MRAIIIEDELPARQIIRSYIINHPEIELVGEFENGYDGAIAIKNLNPDLVFLDIQMPKLNGFEMLEMIDNPPLIIFTTAFDEFAIKAFEINAIDYLLKPFLPERFAKAISKAQSYIKNIHSKPVDYKAIIEFVNNQTEIINRIVVKLQNRIEIILVSDIERFEAQDDYVYIFLKNGNRFIKEITMKYLETHLNPKDFIRVHRSYIIRLDQVSRIVQDDKDNYKIILKSQFEIPVSRSGYKLLKDAMDL